MITARAMFTDFAGEGQYGLRISGDLHFVGQQ